MKKTICAIALILVMASSAAAVDIDFGVKFGLRMYSDSAVKSIYGNGQVIFPYAAVNVLKGLTIGAGYEAAGASTGTIGIFAEDATLKLSGFEVFLAYQYDAGKLVPYASVGFGSFSYSQTVDSPYATEAVEASKATFAAAGGVKFYAFDNLFISAEVKYVPLTVQPLTESVNLGGLRLTVGLGYTLKFAKVKAQG